MRISIDKIVPNPDNPRIIKDDKFKKLVNSIKEFPEMAEVREIVVNKDYMILGGNMRYKAMVEAGWKEVPIRIVDWPEDKQKEFIIKDNVSGGEWDWELLANEWDDKLLDDWGLDVDKSFFEKEVEEDEAPEVDETETISKYGEVYQLGRHRLMCGDATKIDDVEKLMDGQKADMVFTDPPFPNNSGILEDMIVGIEDSFVNARLFCDGDMFWFWDNISEPPFNEMVVARHVWHKTNGWQTNHWEAINVYDGKKERRECLVYSEANVGGENIRDKQGNHPTPKPISLCTIFVKRGNKILDLFGGSGSTLMACEQTDRTCYMMELDPKYCDVIRKRYAKFINKEDEWETTTPKI